MNLIKYYSPKTGERKTIRVAQPSYKVFINWWHSSVFRRPSRRPFMAEADKLMLNAGFVRLPKAMRGRRASCMLGRGRR